jgi:hypothetical protein
MATYHQYSEIVAAYGYRLPPPPPPQASRVGLALIYAAIGVALGTFTGTALAVATLPQQASVLPHINFARSIPSDFRIHAIANAPEAPVIQNHAASSTAKAAPAVSADHASNANANSTPTLLIHQAPVLQIHTTSSMASAAPAPATPKPATAPAASPAHAPVILSHSVIQVADAGKPQILNLAPIVHPAPAVKAQPIKSQSIKTQSINAQSISAHSIKASPVKALALNHTPDATSVAQITVAQPAPLALQPVQKQASSDITLAAAAPIASPLAATAQPQPPAAPSTTALPSSPLAAGLDGSLKPLAFYSEGDATVVSYDATGDTITTDDGRTFVIGATVSASNAVSWQDYRSNVHYRCDQNGNCSLVRTGVIALNARLQ